ncbi:hypothetical protein HDU86_008101 [Geranomyces michiganensis]|nr:hypothetical protein HDU86_008101 [Geranomyces michiganensis]
MAVNVFRLTVLFTLALAGYYFFLSDDYRLQRVPRRAVVGPRDVVGSADGRCTVTYPGNHQFNSPSELPFYTLIYGQQVDQAGAKAACAALGLNLAELSSPVGQPPIQTLLSEFCPDAPSSLSKNTAWIGSWNGDSYNGACIGATGGSKGSFAVNVQDCASKHITLCSSISQGTPSADFCPQCNPNPSGPQCDITASCIKVATGSSSGYQCTCRSGFKSPNAYRIKGDSSNRVYVAPRTACNDVCAVTTGPNACSEVRQMNAECIGGCFPGSATVQVQSATGLEKVPFNKLKAGMSMLVADHDGSQHMSDVAFVVNLSGDLMFATLDYVSDSGKVGQVTLTHGHLIQTGTGASGRTLLLPASQIYAGDKIYHDKENAVTVTATRSHRLPSGSGAFSAIPDRSDALLIVEGILASPYSEDHALADRTFGLGARILYRALKAAGKQHWMEAAAFTAFAETIRPIFADMMAIEVPKKEHVSAAAVAALMGFYLVKKARS